MPVAVVYKSILFTLHKHFFSPVVIASYVFNVNSDPEYAFGRMLCNGGATCKDIDIVSKLK